MMDTGTLRWKFDISAFRLIGRDLITDRVTALFELVKNCYDANANVVSVHFNNVSPDSKGVSSIVIDDDGYGMSFEDVRDKWMVIGTSSKRRNKISPSPYSRRCVGEKGIGRFHGGKVVIDQTAGQRKMKLNVGKANLPFMTWSAGQKEFMPLLLAMYCLSGPPTSVINKDGYKWVVIEEPEMGLHPKAIETVVLQIIELMQNGYKVIVSTHSTILLEFAWAFGILKNLNERTFRKAMCELFSVDTHDSMADLFRDLKEKNVKTYFMSSNGGEGVVSSDISSLDIESDTDFVADWGGLSFFAGKASEIVGKYYQE